MPKYQEGNSERFSTRWEMTVGSSVEDRHTSSNYSLLRSSVIYFSALLSPIVYCEVSFMAKNFFCSVLSVQAAITIHHKLGGLRTTEIYFSQLWRLGSLR